MAEIAYDVALIIPVPREPVVPPAPKPKFGWLIGAILLMMVAAKEKR